MNLNPFRRQQRLQIIRRSQTTLRLHEWRSEKALVSSAMRIMRDPDFQMMLDVMENEHPGVAHVLPDSADLATRAVHQARAEGYTMALANLVALGRFEKMIEPLEATFEPEETLTHE